MKSLSTHLFSICFNFNPNSLPSGILYFVIKVAAFKGNVGTFLSLKKFKKFSNFLSTFFDLKIWKLIKSNKESFPLKYKIVGKDEADLKNKLIYFQSPVGKGLIGKNKNDLVEIKTPAGVKNFEIKDVKYI